MQLKPLLSQKKNKKKEYPKVCPFRLSLISSYPEDVFVAPDHQYSVFWKEKKPILFKFNPRNKTSQVKTLEGYLLLKEKDQEKLEHSLRFKVQGRDRIKIRLKELPIKLKIK